MSIVASWLARLQRPFMVYGFTDPATGLFRRYVRMGSSVVVVDRERMSIGDHVWVGHQTVLDASGGLEIGEGCQIGVSVRIYTHGSHHAIRLLGRSYVEVPAAERKDLLRRPVRIGAYTFIGAGSVILPGANIGKGCIIGPNSVVMSTVPDFSVMAPPPTRVIGNTLDADAEAFRERDFGATYFDPGMVDELRRRAAGSDGAGSGRMDAHRGG